MISVSGVVVTIKTLPGIFCCCLALPLYTNARPLLVGSKKTGGAVVLSSFGVVIQQWGSRFKKGGCQACLTSSKPELVLNRIGYYVPGSICYARAKPSDLSYTGT